MTRIPLPSMRCDTGCGECCGPVLCRPEEYDAVLAHAAARGIEPERQGTTCPWYQHGECQVYDARPFICQLFGHSKRLVCCKEYNTNISTVLERRLTDRHKPSLETGRWLHEILGGDWQEEVLK